jgi:hypothetical protein
MSHDFAQLGRTLYDIQNAETTAEQLTSRGGALRYGSPEYYAYVVEQLVLRHHLVSWAEYSTGLEHQSRRADEAIADAKKRYRQFAADLAAPLRETPDELIGRHFEEMSPSDTGA